MRGKSVFILCLVLIVSMTFVSAGFFDWLTGKAIDEECVDSDNDDYYTKGTTSGSGQSIDDYCKDGTRLMESSCPTESGSPYWFSFQCSNGCDDGACIKSTPTVTCENGVLDGDETGIDCGGSCDFDCEVEVSACNYYIGTRTSGNWDNYCDDVDSLTSSAPGYFAVFDKNEEFVGQCFTRIPYSPTLGCIDPAYKEDTSIINNPEFANIPKLDFSICEGIWNSILEGYDRYQGDANQFYHYKYYAGEPVKEFSSSSLCFDEITGLDETEEVVDGLCSDSDGGRDYYTKGTATSPGKVLDDYCRTEIQLMETDCSDDGNSAYWAGYNCPNGCLDGVCILEEEIKDITEAQDTEESVTDTKTETEAEAIVRLIEESCQGCRKDSKCYDYGYRKSGEFCEDTGEWIVQADSEATCENNFECGSNLCIDSECVEAGLWKKIMNWFAKFF